MYVIRRTYLATGASATSHRTAHRGAARRFWNALPTHCTTPTRYDLFAPDGSLVESKEVEAQGGRWLVSGGWPR